MSEDDPRVTLEDLTSEECWELLAQRSIGRLAVVINNSPDIFPVNFKAWHQEIYVQTAPGLKLAAAVLNPQVAFEVDSIDEADHSGWSVVVRGEATELENLDDLLFAQDLAVGPWAAGVKSRFLQIVPTAIAGRRLPTRTQ
ncbi:MAG: pyridoxamine 5'-phosphate oxidase family protein [Acidimicrobiales bacterium]|nr:pyridoxamine 5'-phosphate oxidase family protein [Acidimicrobiales bacterium]